MGTLGMLGFFAIFHVGGGIAIGSTIRQWLHGGFSLQQPFLLIWGAMFGGIPLCVGAGIFLSQGMPFLIAVQLGVLVATISVTALIPGWFLESFDLAVAMPVLIGGLFLVVGFGIGVSLWRTDTGGALLMLGVFGGVGALVFVLGLLKVLKGQ